MKVGLSPCSEGVVTLRHCEGHLALLPVGEKASHSALCRESRQVQKQLKGGLKGRTERPSIGAAPTWVGRVLWVRGEAKLENPRLAAAPTQPHHFPVKSTVASCQHCVLTATQVQLRGDGPCSCWADPLGAHCEVAASSSLLMAGTVSPY